MSDMIVNGGVNINGGCRVQGILDASDVITSNGNSMYSMRIEIDELKRKVKELEDCIADFYLLKETRDEREISRKV